jgi:prepilin-type processing-associated H-X9-DG protein
MYPPGRIMSTASSQHPGGANVVLGDGKVSFASENIDVHVWRAIGTRAAGDQGKL